MRAHSYTRTGFEGRHRAGVRETWPRSSGGAHRAGRPGKEAGATRSRTHFAQRAALKPRSGEMLVRGRRRPTFPQGWVFWAAPSAKCVRKRVAPALVGAAWRPAARRFAARRALAPRDAERCSVPPAPPPPRRQLFQAARSKINPPTAPGASSACATSSESRRHVAVRPAPPTDHAPNPGFSLLYAHRSHRSAHPPPKCNRPFLSFDLAGEIRGPVSRAI
jgi:hypothetical protein